MHELPGYARAQREWEDRLPPEDGPSDCQDCNGSGTIPDPSDPEGDYVECSACEGFGQVVDGEPYDPSKAACEAEYYADSRRDAMLDE